MNLNILKFVKDEYLFITLPGAKNSWLSIGLLTSFSDFCRCTTALAEISQFACPLGGWWWWWWPVSSTLGVNELITADCCWGHEQRLFRSPLMKFLKIWALLSAWTIVQLLVYCKQEDVKRNWILCKNAMVSHSNVFSNVFCVFVCFVFYKMNLLGGGTMSPEPPRKFTSLAQKKTVKKR